MLKLSPIILIGCLTGPLAQAKITFVESINADRAVSLENVIAQVADWSKQKGAFLSLGESHREPETVRPLNFVFAKTFMNGVTNKYTLCSETIADYLDSPQGQEMQKSAEQNLIFTGNGPAKTDFTNCKFSSKSNAITYSGFYHQYPFAKAWPLDFPVSPVTSEEDNNIRSQLAPHKGMFITQMELSYASFLASQNLLKDKTLSADEFRRRAEALLKNSDMIKSKMNLLLGDRSEDFKNKFGLFLPKEAFSENVSMTPQSWILLTQRGYALQQKSFLLLSNLLQFKDEQLEKFLMKLKNSKPFFISPSFGPNADGKRSSTIFSGIEMDGESELLQFQNVTIVAEFGKTGFSCYTSADGQTHPADCESVMF